MINKPKKSEKPKKKGKLATILLIIALLLIGGGAGTLAKVYFDNKSAQEQAFNDVHEFEKKVENQTPEEEKDESNTNGAIPAGALGVLYIPSFNNFEHLIGYGVDYNTLNTYVGMYKTYSQIGEEGNCILAAHSNVLPGPQAYCFFNRIEDYVKNGDEISVLWHDGNTYKYKVIQVSTWVPAENEESYFSNAPEGKQYVILQTCTHGDGRYRTFIRCERTDDE